MRLVSAPVVLGTAAVLTGPALWSAFVTEELAAETALARFALAAALTWAALWVLAAMVGEPPRPVEPARDPSAAGPDGTGPGADDTVVLPAAEGPAASRP